jgi:ABC-type sugar transport system substrate-binding protein
MENILLAHPDLAAVLCACDNIVFGAAQPAKNRGVRRVIVGFDSITEAMDAIIRLMPRLCSSQGKLLS